jgi:hypothetical protein
VIGELLLALAVLGLPLVLPPVVVMGLRAEVVYVAPLAGGVVAGLASLLTYVVAGSPLLWFAVICGVLNVAGVATLVGRRGRLRLRAPRLVDGARLTAVLLIGAVVAVVILPPLRTPTLDWDARSIWMLHARWLFAGHVYAAAALSNPVFSFSHPDYPPLVPGTVAIAWQLHGGVDLRLAQVLIAVLNACGCALLGCAVMSVLERSSVALRLLCGVIAGGVVAGAAVGVAGIYAVDGYADLLYAACAAAAAVFGLVAPRSRAHLTVACVAAVASALTKNEGIVAAAFILAATAVRYVSPWPLSWSRVLRTGSAVVLPLLAIAVWPVTIRLAGAASDLTMQSNVSGLLHLDSTVLSRIPPTLTTIGAYYTLLPIAGAAAVCGALALRRQRSELGAGAAPWPWLIMILTTAVLVVTYAVGPYPIAWWLSHSSDRTTILVRLLLLSELGAWFGIALHAGVHTAREALRQRSAMTAEALHTHTLRAG